MEINPTKLLFAAPQCLSKKNSSNPIPSRVLSPAPCLSWKRSPMDVLLLAVLLLALLALLLTRPAATQRCHRRSRGADKERLMGSEA